jgi:hypothetical protein
MYVGISPQRSNHTRQAETLLGCRPVVVVVAGRKAPLGGQPSLAMVKYESVATPVELKVWTATK